MIGTIVDACIIGLLFAAMALGVLVHHRLRTLQRSLSEIEPVILGLGDLPARAEAASAGLKAVAGDVDTRFTAQLGAAQRLADELRLLTDRGDRAAEHLSTAIRSAREATIAATGPPSVPPLVEGKDRGPTSRVEIERALSRLR